MINSRTLVTLVMEDFTEKGFAMILVKVQINNHILYTSDGKTFFEDIPADNIGFVSVVEAKKAIRRLRKAFDAISSIKKYENIKVICI